MDKPRKKLRRKIGEVVRDVKQNMRARKGSRKIKQSMKGSVNKPENVTRDRRGTRREKLEDAASQYNVTGTRRLKRKEYQSLKESALDLGGKRIANIKVPGKKKRAIKSLKRMDKADERRLKRKLK